MTKQQLLERVKSSGVKGMLAARRIANSSELSRLPDDADITLATLEKWIAESPRLAGMWKTGPIEPLSESDFRLIGRKIRQENRPTATAPSQARPDQTDDEHN
jgi:hypothetical protein